MKKCLLLLPLLGVCSTAFAEAATAAKGPSMINNLIMIAGFIFIAYFMLIRPQTKRAKEQQALLTSIAKEDEVVTAGGLIGKVLRVSEQFLVLAIAEGIEVKVQKHAVTAVLPKGTMKTI